MDLEGLTKAQLILLTLLVSFITSIATGIMTVALLGQVPDPVTRTINNVIERTIEKVVPGDSVKPVPTTSSATTNEQITSAIEKNAKSVVRVYTVSDATGTSTNVDEHGTFRGLGVIVGSDGIVAVPDNIAVKGRTYLLVLQNGTTLGASIVTEGRGDVALLKLTLSTSTSVTPSALGKPGTLKLGETVVALSGETRTSVSVGTISDRIPDSKGTIVGLEAQTAGIETAGSVLFTAGGSAVGLYIPESKRYTALSSDLIAELLKPATEKPKSTSTGEGNTASVGNAPTP